MFRWLRVIRRKKLAAKPFPAQWVKYLKKHVPFFNELSGTDRDLFLTNLHVFAQEKTFIAAGDMKITDRIRAVISAGAVRLIQGLDLSYYDRLTEIIVYPGHFVWPDGEVMYGETHEWNVVVLSWKAVLHGLRDPDHYSNPLVHEFAHILDRADGDFDGTPCLSKPSQYKEWAEVMTRHFLKLKEGSSRETSVLDDYGAINESEFFAVATEAFFDRPKSLRKQLPSLYRQLKRFYRQDPASDTIWAEYCNRFQS
jgi:MtfA peptidase